MIPPPSNLDISITHCKGTCSCTQQNNPNYHYPISTSMPYLSLPFPSQLFIASLNSISIPKFVSKTLSQDGWCADTEEKMIALETNHTYDIVSTPMINNLLGANGHSL